MSTFEEITTNKISKVLLHIVRYIVLVFAFFVVGSVNNTYKIEAALGDQVPPAFALDGGSSNVEFSVSDNSSMGTKEYVELTMNVSSGLEAVYHGAALRRFYMEVCDYGTTDNCRTLLNLENTFSLFPVGERSLKMRFENDTGPAAAQTKYALIWTSSGFAPGYAYLTNAGFLDSLSDDQRDNGMRISVSYMLEVTTDIALQTSKFYSFVGHYDTDHFRRPTFSISNLSLLATPLHEHTISFSSYGQPTAYSNKQVARIMYSIDLESSDESLDSATRYKGGASSWNGALTSSDIAAFLTQLNNSINTLGVGLSECVFVRIIITDTVYKSYSQIISVHYDYTAPVPDLGNMVIPSSNGNYIKDLTITIPVVDDPNDLYDGSDGKVYYCFYTSSVCDPYGSTGESFSSPRGTIGIGMTGEYRVRIGFKDVAGNKYDASGGIELSDSYKFDNTAPVISFSTPFSPNGVAKSEGKTSVSVSIYYTDSHSGGSKIYYCWSTSNVSCTSSFSSKSATGPSFSASISYSNNGERFLFVKAEDKLGNTSTVTTSNAFHIVSVEEKNTSNAITYHYTLKDAFNDAATGGTVKLLKNTSSAPTLPSGKSLSLDMNDFNISTNEAAIINNGTLNLTGTGSIISDIPLIPSTNHVNIISNYGTLTVGGNITITVTSSASSGLGNYNLAGIVTTGTVNLYGKIEFSEINYLGIKGISGLEYSRINMSGGSINISSLSSSYAAYGISTTGELSMLGGSITVSSTNYTATAISATGDNKLIHVQYGDITSSHLMFEGDNSTIKIGVEGSGVTDDNVVLKGTTIGAEIDYFYDGRIEYPQQSFYMDSATYSLFKNTEPGYAVKISYLSGRYYIVLVEAIIEDNDGNRFAMLTDALNITPTGKTFMLLKSITQQVLHHYNKIFTLDLAGFDISYNGNAVSISSNSELTIKGNGTISSTMTGSGYYGISITGSGKLYLGQDDETVSQDNPVIRNGINGNIAGFYDGKIYSTTNIISNVKDTPLNYYVYSDTDNGETYYYLDQDRVATVNNAGAETTYSSLQSAVSAAPTGSTVTLLKNTNKRDCVIVKDSKNLVLNIGSYTVKCHSSTTNATAISIESGSTLRIVGTGTIEAITTNSYSNAFGVKNAGNLVIENATVQAQTSGAFAPYAIYNDGEGAEFEFLNGALTATSSGTAISYAIYNDKGKVTISGGGITASGGGFVYAVYTNQGNVTISAGIINATGYSTSSITAISNNNGNLVISGGTVNVSNTSTGAAIGVSNSSTGTLTLGEAGGSLVNNNPTIYGGISGKITYFYDGRVYSTTDIRSNVENIEEECAVVSGVIGSITYYYLTSASAIYNSAYYDTVTGAIGAIATNGTGTITLLKNVSECISIPEGKTITLNLNGKSLFCSVSTAITNRGTFTLTGVGEVSATVGGIYNAYSINNYGTATISPSIVEGNESKDILMKAESQTGFPAAIYNSGGTVNLQPGEGFTATLKSSSAEAYMVYGVYNETGENTVNINDRTIIEVTAAGTGYAYGIYNLGTKVNITGGSIIVGTTGTATEVNGRTIAGAYVLAGELSMSDGSINVSKNDGGSDVIGVLNKSAFTFSGGNITVSSSSVGIYGIAAYEGSTTNLTGGTLTINNSSSTASSRGVYDGCIQSTCSLNVTLSGTIINVNVTEDGEGEDNFQSVVGVMINYGEFIITGGNVNVNASGADRFATGLVISGSSSEIIISSLEIVVNATSEAAGIYQTGNNITFANGSSIRVVSSAGTSIGINTGSSTNIAGGNIVVEGYSPYGIRASGEITISGGKIEVKGTAQGSYGILCRGGKLIMSDGEIVVNSGTNRSYSNSAIYISSSQTSSITGGTVTITSTEGVGATGVYIATGEAEVTFGGVRINVTSDGLGIGVQCASSNSVTVNSGFILNVTSVTGGGQGFYMDGSSSLNIIGGTISISSAGISIGINTASSGSVTVTSGTFNVSSTSSNSYGIYLRNASSKVTMSGGTIVAGDAGVYIEASSAEFTISGGTVTATGETGTVYGIYNNGNATIQGGTITSTHTGTATSGSRGLVTTSLSTTTIGVAGGTLYPQLDANDNPVTPTYPTIGGYIGISDGGGNINFYDGIVMGSSIVCAAGTTSVSCATIIDAKETGTYIYETSTIFYLKLDVTAPVWVSFSNDGANEGGYNVSVTITFRDEHTSVRKIYYCWSTSTSSCSSYQSASADSSGSITISSGTLLGVQYLYVKADDETSNMSTVKRTDNPFYLGKVKNSFNYYYLTLQDAITGTTSGTITLLANVSECVEVVSPKIITLNMNGKSLSCLNSASPSVAVTNRGVLTLSGVGEVFAYGRNSYYAYAIDNYGTLTISPSTVEGNESKDILVEALSQSGTATAINNSGGTVNLQPGTEFTATVKSSSSSSGNVYGIYNQTGGNTINVKVRTTIEVNSSTRKAYGIYNSGTKVNITGGSVTVGATGTVDKISGGEIFGVYVASGELLMSGGSITASLTNGGSAVYGVENFGGTFTFSNGNITVGSASIDTYAYGVSFRAGSTTNLTGGTLTVNNSSATGYGFGLRDLCSSACTSTKATLAGTTINSNVTGDGPSGSHGFAFGIEISYSELIITRGTVNVTASGANLSARGLVIYANSPTITINSLELVVNGTSEAIGINNFSTLTFASGSIRAVSSAGSATGISLASAANSSITGGSIVAEGYSASNGIQGFSAKLTISGGTIEAKNTSTNSYGIQHLGELIMSGGEIVVNNNSYSATGISINGSQVSSLTGGTVTVTGTGNAASRGVKIGADAEVTFDAVRVEVTSASGTATGVLQDSTASKTITINSGFVLNVTSMAGAASGLLSSGAGGMNIAGGNITVSTISGSADGISHNGTGNIIVIAGTISSSSSSGLSSGVKIYGSLSKMTMSGGTISAESIGIHITSAEFTISGGTVTVIKETGEAYGIYNGGKANIQGGTITSTHTGTATSDSRGLYAASSSVTTIGVPGGTLYPQLDANDNPITPTYPTIGGYIGISDGGGNINFYDGIVMGSSIVCAAGTTSVSCETIIDAKETGTYIYETSTIFYLKLDVTAPVWVSFSNDGASEGSYNVSVTITFRDEHTSVRKIYYCWSTSTSSCSSYQSASADSSGSITISSGTLLGVQYLYVKADDETSNMSTVKRTDNPFYLGKVKNSFNYYYLTLQDAITGTTSGTITLLTNVTECVEVVSPKIITLNMNGKTLTCNSSKNVTLPGGDSTLWGYYAIDNSGSLTINGSGTVKINVTTGSGVAMGIINRGTLTLVNGTIDVVASISYGLYLGLGTTTTIGTKGDSMSQSDPLIKAATGIYDLGSTIKFYDGKIQATSYACGSGTTCSSIIDEIEDKTYIVETTTVANLEIDTTGPSISISPDGMSSWATQTGAITVSATDAHSLMGNISYCWSSINSCVDYTSGGSDTSGSKTFSISVPSRTTSGKWYLHIKATDKWGNQSTKQSNVYNVGAIEETGTKTMYYNTLASAFSGATSGNTVKLLISINECSAVLGSEKTLTLKLNGKSIICNSGADKIITNNGTLNVEGSGIMSIAQKSTTASTYGINNAGTLNYKDATLNVIPQLTANVNNTAYGIYNTGTLNINGGSINVTNIEYTIAIGVYNQSGATLNITGGAITSSGSKTTYGVSNSGTFTMSGGSITSQSSNLSVGISNSLSATITGGTITSTASGTSKGYGINNIGTIEMSKGIVAVTTNSGEARGISSTGTTINLTGGIDNVITVTSTLGNVYGIYDDSTSTHTVTVASTINVNKSGTSEGGTVVGVEIKGTSTTLYVKSGGNISAININTSSDVRGISSGGTVYVEDGELSISSGAGNGYGIYNTGTAIVQGGSIIVNAAGGNAVGISNLENLSVIAGTITAAADTAANGLGVGNNSTFAITGGTIIGSGYAFTSFGGAVTYTGGELRGNKDNRYTYQLSTASISHKLSDTDKKNEYTYISGNQYITTIVDSAMKIGSTAYTTLQSAVNAAATSTIALNKNITLNEKVTIGSGKNITLSLSSKVLNNFAEYINGSGFGSETYNFITVNNGGYLKITGSSGNALQALYLLIRVEQGGKLDLGSRVKLESKSLQSVIDVAKKKDLYLATNHHIVYATSSTWWAYSATMTSGSKIGTKDSTITTITIVGSNLNIELTHTESISSGKTMSIYLSDNENYENLLGDDETEECTSNGTKTTCTIALSELDVAFNMTYNEEILIYYEEKSSGVTSKVETGRRSFVVTPQHTDSNGVANKRKDFTNGSGTRTHTIISDGGLVIIERLATELNNISIDDNDIKTWLFGEQWERIFSSLVITRVGETIVTVNGVRFGAYKMGVAATYNTGYSVADSISFKSVSHIYVYDYTPKTDMEDVATLSAVTCEAGSACNVSALSFTDYVGGQVSNVVNTITYNGRVVDSIDTNVLGTYKVTSIATDRFGYVSDPVVREYIVVDNQAPIITYGSEPLVVELGKKIVDRDDVIVVDNVDTNLVVSKSYRAVDVNREGTYKLIYEVIDSSGNTTITYRDVIVKDMNVSKNSNNIILIMAIIGASLLLVGGGTAFIYIKKKKLVK